VHPLYDVLYRRPTPGASSPASRSTPQCWTGCYGPRTRRRASGSPSRGLHPRLGRPRAPGVPRSRAGRAQGVRRLPRSERAAVFDRIKIEGVLESSLGVVVCYDPGRGSPAVLGRHAIADAGLYSVCLAIEKPVAGGHRRGPGRRLGELLPGGFPAPPCSACPPASARWPGCALAACVTCPMFPIWSDTGGGNGCHSMTLSTMSGTVSGQAGSLARVETASKKQGTSRTQWSRTIRSKGDSSHSRTCACAC